MMLRSKVSAFTVSPTSLSYGNLAINTTSAAKTVTISNSGTVVLPIASIRLMGTNANQFSKTADTCSSSSVAPDQTCSVTVTFAPTTTGAKAAVLDLLSNASNVPSTTTTPQIQGLTAAHRPITTPMRLRTAEPASQISQGVSRQEALSKCCQQPPWDCDHLVHRLEFIRLTSGGYKNHEWS